MSNRFEEDEVLAAVKDRLDVIHQLAAVSLSRGSRPEAELVAALEAAWRGGVTTLEYLRMRLLLETGIPTEWRDDGAGDEQC